MLFQNVIGQQEVKQQLVEMVQHNRLSHALLFLGKEGSGAFSKRHWSARGKAAVGRNGAAQPFEPRFAFFRKGRKWSLANGIGICPICEFTSDE
ncbi:MAG: hypothetical protein EOO53_22515 [Gammaproteobacteria bacterium]|nr:MAG: hypothetical protein EOO53_22515 [Gammaproteobacteria bacterium]